MIGIYDCFGYGEGYDVSFMERYRLIKNAGFDSVMLWWSDRFGRGVGYQKDALYSRDAGLEIENIHAPVHQQNCLSLNSLDGESVYKSYLECVKDCCEYSIPTMVIHLPDDDNPINNFGLKRLSHIIDEAQMSGINVAFENLNNISNLALALEKFKQSNVGYCYDSCHQYNYSADIDLLELYGDRLMALHLQDNGGAHNQHQLPFDGNINWNSVMKSIADTGYQGATCLEPMNWDYQQMTIKEFLNLAFIKAKKLDDMRKSYS